ncbi:LacI family transcriptional regulator [Martelella lutilitoris]|uniref:LacI family transcriptional regulator n=1 Tax=Martelella lutilitoris TaxID=2583532 RepID=A0A5C4JUM3_9HYPH|nr:LacI family DNA-binding transcriptional regulator [Martelella lutilitoris]TNB48904.1 LacI family transcriptional regulator [Martelella lutilitoris]
MKSKTIPTIRDIAAASGVSAATVSLVLNGKGEISEATRVRVLEAVSRLKYVPRASRSRSSEVKETLRFLKIAKHGQTVNRDHSHFISDYIDGMSQEALRRGYALEVTSHDGETIAAIAEAVAGAAGVSGIIALGTELSEGDIRLLQSVGTPIVFIDTFHDVVEANFVNMNNIDAVYKVLERFKSRGFSRIGFVASHVGTTNFKLRYDAFFRNMERLGLEVDPSLIISVESTFNGAHRGTSEYLASGGRLAECYFCTNDIMAFGFARALRENGIGIPEDVSLIGFDNLPMSATSDPPLTTIDVSKRKIGFHAVALLDDIINGPPDLPCVKMLVGADLVARSSG